MEPFMNADGLRDYRAPIKEDAGSAALRWLLLAALVLLMLTLGVVWGRTL